MKRYDVICPGCKGVFHETNEHYSPDQTSNGAMFRLKEKYGPQGYNWQSFPNNTSIRSGGLECPQCGALYCGGGVKVTVKPQGEEPVKEPVVTTEPTKEPVANRNDAHVCPACGKVCKTKGALGGHMRFCKEIK